MPVTANKEPVAALHLGDDADAAAPLDTQAGGRVLSIRSALDVMAERGLLKNDAAHELLARLGDAGQEREVLIVDGRDSQGLDALWLDDRMPVIRKLGARGLAVLAINDRAADRMVGINALDPLSDLGALPSGSLDKPPRRPPPPKATGYLKPGTSPHRASRKRSGVR